MIYYVLKELVRDVIKFKRDVLLIIFYQNTIKLFINLKQEQMKKTFKVVMLPTEKASSLFSYNSDKHILFYEHGRELTTVTTHFELYIISDDEIKEGDWCIMLDSFGNVFSNVQQYLGKSKGHYINKGIRKIIATTDKSLKLIKRVSVSDNIIDYPDELPQLPEQFIQAYIKAYNEGKPIIEVDLEIEQTKLYIKPEDIGQYESKPKQLQHPHTTNPDDIWSIKTRPDNTVICHTSKMYSKDEMLKAYKAGFYLDSIHGKYGSQDQNLKFDEFINNL